MDKTEVEDYNHEKHSIHSYSEKYETERVDNLEAHVDLHEEDNSPIEEVRVTVANTDDPSMPCNTFRMWFLGLLFTAVISFVNQFFYMRQTQISIGYSVVALLSLPLGHLMARVLPTGNYTLFGRTFSLNPGPFSIKEHILIGTMTACNTSTAYAVDIVVLQHVFYHDKQPFIAGLLLVLTTQITGFALAGVIRRFLVRPAHMVWPSTLVTASLFRSLHISAETAEDEGRMSRMKYFLIITLGSFLCLLVPMVSPLVTPWFAQLNILVGFILVAWVMVPWAYYTNLWNSKNYPILSAGLFRENGSAYDKDQILTDSVFDQEKYNTYGPMRMDSFFALTYGVGFAGLTATIVHVLLYNGKEMVARWKSARAENEDIHSRLMRVYPEVPDWWYGLLFVITLALSLVTCIVWDFMPWWAVLLALAIAIIFVLPVGIVQA
ncbi:hypothetical protein CPC16_001674, partial [Podila verticillata]